MLTGKGEEEKKMKRQLQVFTPNAIQCGSETRKELFVAEENIQKGKW